MNLYRVSVRRFIFKSQNKNRFSEAVQEFCADKGPLICQDPPSLCGQSQQSISWDWDLMPTGGPEVFPQGELWSVLMSCLCKQNPGTWSERLRVVSFLLWVTGIEIQSIYLMVDSHGHRQANILDSRIWTCKSQRDRMLHGHTSSQHSHGPIFPIWVDTELAKLLKILSYLRTSRPCSEGSFSA